MKLHKNIKAGTEVLVMEWEKVSFYKGLVWKEVEILVSEYYFTADDTNFKASDVLAFTNSKSYKDKRMIELRVAKRVAVDPPELEKDGRGRVQNWSTQDTKHIIVPKYLEDQILKYAHALDDQKRI